MDNFDLRKYLVENKVTTNSRMVNENENESKVLNLYDLSDDDYNKLVNDLLEKHMVDLDDFLKSKGASPDEIEEIMSHDENTFEETQNILGVKFPLLYVFEIGGIYVDNELVYDVGNGHVAIVEDYTETYVVVPRSAFEEFKNAIQAKLS
jgi:predicted hydrolase (HD superfamily)